MHQSLFITAALALVYASTASARICKVGIYRAAKDNNWRLRAARKIRISMDDTPMQFQWDYKDGASKEATYKVELHYEGCEAKVVGDQKLPAYLTIKGTISEDVSVTGHPEFDE
ncbi:hypothetical protein MGG_16475 [Pyricularia oryzae 70-15]|uniref:Uncharacterized protein n=3 Tax=Pyricularia oryzae TaxID=318829 RepID=G4MQB6_PYRO7|nr:uncharacterized protein MGG_16475 [Pyricularia oryzae 70-15]EHA58102.1 hypothetical protein MGG_16475 [Pyricularia oryzae 70-15]ELQ39441.1 hypothetical protein OOU_Y34scaffold00498g24 [Pyricularia oryzae Y34]KAI7915160.1 hypothetical protein M9X92_008563 [Pyricularia oryzae]KAI7917385.1 hypothetical protein M0657_008138 [Pyricularia oryzae]